MPRTGILQHHRKSRAASNYVYRYQLLKLHAMLTRLRWLPAYLYAITSSAQARPQLLSQAIGASLSEPHIGEYSRLQLVCMHVHIIIRIHTYRKYIIAKFKH